MFNASQLSELVGVTPDKDSCSPRQSGVTLGLPRGRPDQTREADCSQIHSDYDFTDDTALNCYQLLHIEVAELWEASLGSCLQECT